MKRTTNDSPGRDGTPCRPLRFSSSATKLSVVQGRHGVPSLAWMLFAAAAVASASGAEISFNRDIRPILSANCYACHGPDKKARKADRRLDTRDGALADSEGVRAIVPGNLEQSELVLRISSNDPDEIMPPPKSDKKLTVPQIAL